MKLNTCLIVALSSKDYDTVFYSFLVARSSFYLTHIFWILRSLKNSPPNPLFFLPCLKFFIVIIYYCMIRIIFLASSVHPFWVGFSISISDHWITIKFSYFIIFYSKAWLVCQNSVLSLVNARWQSYYDKVSVKMTLQVSIFVEVRIKFKIAISLLTST